MLEIKPVIEVGQIKVGDILFVEKKSGYKFIALAKEVLQQGLPTEEIIINLKQNDYFVMSMFLDGKSLVKNCSILHFSRCKLNKYRK